jgi:hypothetical protein
MPDFDTRRPQEPDQPDRLHMFVVASRLRTSARVQLRNKNIIGLLGIGGGILLLAVVAVVTIVWAVLPHPQTPADQLDQELQPTSTPAYELLGGGFQSTTSYCDSSECGVTRACPRGISFCGVVTTEANGARKLASITENAYSVDEAARILNAVPNVEKVDELSLEFYDASLPDSAFGLRLFQNATSYCFVEKDRAVSTLRGKLNKAELLGKTDNCYVAVYEGSGPRLKTKPS